MEVDGLPDTNRQRPLHVALVAGTRPEIIKLAPLLRTARMQSDLRVSLIATGQHGMLAEDALRSFGLEADMWAGASVAGLAPDAAVETIRDAVGRRLGESAPDLVVVQGDTSSALAGALAAQALGVPLAHVEAGLRSGDPLLPWPEEGNRIAIDRIADYLFAPGAREVANLHAEGVQGRVYQTGNTGIDALLQVRAQVRPIQREVGTAHILVTAHRRENAGLPAERIAAALRRIAAVGPDRRISVVLHTNPVAETLRSELTGVVGIDLLPATDFTGFVALMDGADLVLTDSGGLQEECPALGVPVLILRSVTERPAVIDCGNARLVGTDTDAIVGAVEGLLADPAARLAMARPSFPYGEGDAAERIISAILRAPLPRR